MHCSANAPQARLELRRRLYRLPPLRAGRNIHFSRQGSRIGARCASEQLAADGVGHGEHARRHGGSVAAVFPL